MSLHVSFKTLTSFATAIALSFAMCAESQAGWGSWGSGGGSRGYGSGGSGGLFSAYGSHGSSGYGSSGYGSSGGGHRVLFPRLRSFLSGSNGSSGGSSGGYYGSSGGRHYGSSGGHYGSSGGYGSHGSSGGSYSYYGGSSGGSGSHGSVGGFSNYGSQNDYYQGGIPIDSGMYAPNNGVIVPQGNIYEGTLDGVIPPTGPVIESPQDGGTGGAGTQENSTSTGEAILNVQVPLDAKLYVNGKLTRTKGESRRFVSRSLKPGRSYTYEVQAVVEGRGVMTRMVDLRVGDDKPLVFDFDDTSEKVTSVTVQVPADAEVVLAGNKSATRGPIRFFSTKSLKPGDSWDNYTVEVSFEVDGRKVTRTKSISITGGKSHEIDFMDEYEKVARR